MKLTADRKHKGIVIGAIVVWILVLVGVSILAAAPAHARPPASQYVTPFGAGAPWNIPVKGLPRHPQSSTYASRMYNSSPDKAGNFNMSFVDYTYPVFYVEDATTTYTVNGGYSTPNGSINGSKLPWNPAWSAAGGSDAQVILLDPVTGREWDLWKVSISGSTLNVSGGSLVPGSYHTRTEGWPPSRGVGIQYLAMLVRPEEVARDEIRHALSLPVSNPSKTTYVPPATKLEHSGSDSGDEVPEGMRFALDVTDAQIESWVATKPAAYRKLARTVAFALRDYGWFVTDTSGAAHFQFEARASADALWKAQGIDPASTTARDLLDGLITQSRIYTLVPSDQYGTTPPPPPPPTNRPPVISGTPALAAISGTPYSFQPAASDPDGDALTFSISGKPAWASFSTTTGRLSGTPAAGNPWTYPNIVIGVSDGTVSASLPAFSLTVTDPPPPANCAEAEAELALCSASNTSLTNSYNAAVKKLQDYQSCVQACAR